MFLIRQSKPKDAGTLLKLARMVYFINLPPYEAIIAEKIAHSARCFTRAGGGEVAEKPSRRPRKGGVVGLAEQDSDLFMFTIEDTEAGGVIGTSQVKAHMGGPGNPNWSMKLSEKRFFSPELRQGTTHTVAKLHADESGPSEIGGLILAPSHRGHRQRPGRFLSFVRFHFIALHAELFAERILAEMIGPVSNDGDSPFWDAFGRKFIPVKYAEADRFCQFNRNFISELLPDGEIYITLFPLEIQNLVGVVSREALPARRLLESLGFKNRGFVDPFDGGPHLDAATKDIELIRSTRKLELGKAIAPERCDNHAIVSVLSEKGEFRAIECACMIDGESVRVPAKELAALEASAGAEAGVTPLEPWDPEPAAAPAASAASKGGKRAARRKVRA